MADFFEKITGGIDKGIKTVSSKGKELIETTKLKGEIKDVQNLIQSKFQALGKKVPGDPFPKFNSILPSDGIKKCQLEILLRIVILIC